MTTCEEAKQMRSGINVQAKVVDKGEVRTVNTKFGEISNSILIESSSPSSSIC